MSNTTVLVDSSTRDALARTRDAYKSPSMDDAIRRVLRDATPTAQETWDRHKAAALKVCKAHRVTRLIAFGSRCRADRHPGSDLDLVVEFPVENGVKGLFALRDELTSALEVKVDLGSLPPKDSRLWKRIAEEGVALVGPPPQ